MPLGFYTVSLSGVHVCKVKGETKLSGKQRDRWEGGGQEEELLLGEMLDA